MKLLKIILSAAVICGLVSAEEPAKKPVSAFGRKFIHRDGTYTLSAKQRDRTTIVEETYNKNDVLICKRVFQTDSQGRLRNGVVYDGRKNPLGSIYYGYDKKTDQITKEVQFNKKGQLLREVYYPGALKDYPGIDPRLANRGVALVYNPDDPRAKPVQQSAPPPTAPVQSEQNEFTPGIIVGAPAQPVPATATPAAGAVPTVEGGARSSEPKAPRRNFFGPSTRQR